MSACMVIPPTYTFTRVYIITQRASSTSELWGDQIRQPLKVSLIAKRYMSIKAYHDRV